MPSNAATAASMSAQQGHLSSQESPNTMLRRLRAILIHGARSHLFFSEWFDQITDAIAAERKLKGWSRAKKLAFIRGDFAKLQTLAKRRS